MTPDTSPQPSSLCDAVLLASTGGLLDAIVYLNHGHVFANAMTGNVIFLGIAVLGHQWREVIPHVIPILGFFAGVTTSRHLRSRSKHAAIIGLAFEIVALFALGWLPLSFPHMAFTAIIAYVAALQVASFRRVTASPSTPPSLPATCATQSKASTTRSLPPRLPKFAKKAVLKPLILASSASVSWPELSLERGPPHASAITASG